MRPRRQVGSPPLLQPRAGPLSVYYFDTLRASPRRLRGLTTVPWPGPEKVVGFVPLEDPVIRGHRIFEEKPQAVVDAVHQAIGMVATGLGG